MNKNHMYVGKILQVNRNNIIIKIVCNILTLFIQKIIKLDNIYKIKKHI